VGAPPVVVITDTDLGGVDLEVDLLSSAGFEPRFLNTRNEDDIVAGAADATALLAQFAPITRRVIESLPQLRAVARFGTGLDNIDLAAASEHGVEVRGVSGYCTDEVADHTLALLLSITRATHQAATDVANGSWLPGPDYPAITLTGRTIGLVGYGRIGRAVAKRATAFGMQVAAHDPLIPAKSLLAEGITPLSLQDVFASDVVSLHLPQTPETKGLVSTELLSLMKPGSILLNVSRGGLVDEPALIAALDAGTPAFAGLDVLATEPAGAEHPLVQHPRALVTPHLGYYSPAAIEELRRQTALAAIDLLSLVPS
jgi:D-3-phosphoglycerate dehydrogenase